MHRFIAITLLASQLLVGCHATTTIESKPSGAEALMDGRILGPTPVKLSEPVWVWTDHRLVVRKDGYEESVVQMKNTGFQLGFVAACVCTAGILLPLMFVSKYPNQFLVELRPKAPATASNEAVREEPTVSFQ